MIRKVLIVGMFYCLSACTFSQTSKDVEKLSGNPISDLPFLLKKGTHKADIMDSIVQTPEQLRILGKFQKAIQENYTWYIEFLKTVPEGQPVPYDGKLGITQEEYKVISTMNEHTSVVPSAKEDLTIIHKDDFIYFKGTGRLMVFDSLKIDLLHNNIQFLDYQIPYSDTIRITDEKNGLKSKWFGFAYKLEVPKGLTLDDLKDLKSLNYKSFKMTIGQLERTRKPYLDFSARVIENGVKTLEIRVPVVFE